MFVCATACDILYYGEQSYRIEDFAHINIQHTLWHKQLWYVLTSAWPWTVDPENRLFFSCFSRASWDARFALRRLVWVLKYANTHETWKEKKGKEKDKLATDEISFFQWIEKIKKVIKVTRGYQSCHFLYFWRHMITSAKHGEMKPSLRAYCRSRSS